MDNKGQLHTHPINNNGYEVKQLIFYPTVTPCCIDKDNLILGLRYGFYPSDFCDITNERGTSELVISLLSVTSG